MAKLTNVKERVTHVFELRRGEERVFANDSSFVCLNIAVPPSRCIPGDVLKIWALPYASSDNTKTAFECPVQYAMDSYLGNSETCKTLAQIGNQISVLFDLMLENLKQSNTRELFPILREINLLRQGLNQEYQSKGRLGILLDRAILVPPRYKFSFGCKSDISVYFGGLLAQPVV